MRFNKDSRVIVTRRIGEIIGRDGIKRIRVSKEVLENPLSLGSLMNPKNNNIIKIEYETRQENIFGNIFGGLFK